MSSLKKDLKKSIVPSEAGQWRLLEMVYSDPSALWANLCMAGAAGAVCIVRIQSPWIVLWTISGLAIATVRLVDFYSFSRRRQSTPIRALRRTYITLAWLLGAFWGCGSLVVVWTNDPVVHFWVINPLTAIVVSAVARNNSIPEAARGQVFLTLVPTLFSCLASSDGYIQLYSAAVFFFIPSSLGIANSLYSQTVQLLDSNETNSALLLKLGETNQQLEIANDMLNVMTITDGLTQIKNRRFFDMMIENEWGRAKRSLLPLSVMMIDVDHFKAYNDINGHQAGDECLRQIADAISKSLFRHGDFVARYGGEEFAVVLPGADRLGAIDAGERIRTAVEKLSRPTKVSSLEKASSTEIVTISIGVATMSANIDRLDSMALVAAADQNLYRAKKEGRNCVRGDNLELLSV